MDYNPNTLNLESRENKIMGLKEGFSYDNLDRLTDVRIVNGKHTSTVYEDNGNIKTKTDVGTYAYDANKINAVKNITAPVNQSDISTLNQDITYTSFNKVKTIKENDYEITYHYGADFKRKKAELKYQNQLQYTKYYHGNFEKIVEASGKTTEVTQVNSLNGNVAVHVKTTQNNQINNNVFFVYTDQLGSPLVLTNNTGDIVYEQSFDAWGLILRGSFALWQNGKLGLSNSLKKSPSNWNDYENIPETPTWLRGYTGHEHLPEFDLINMNGRMYDPITATMLSADPLVSDPENIQNYNRYSYVLNNPLKYVDPSGYGPMPSGYSTSHQAGTGMPGGGPTGPNFGAMSGNDGTKKGDNDFVRGPSEDFKPAFDGFGKPSPVKTPPQNTPPSTPPTGYYGQMNLNFQNNSSNNFSENIYSGENFSLSGMFFHYQFGGGKDYFINASTIDFSETNQKELGLDKIGIGQTLDPVNLFNSGINANSLAFGKLTMKRISATQFSIAPNMFDFDYQPEASWQRNAGTFLGLVINETAFTPLIPAVFGGPYNVIFIGTVTIPK